MKTDIDNQAEISEGRRMKNMKLKAKSAKQAARKILSLLGHSETGSLQAGLAATQIVATDDESRQAKVYTHCDLVGTEVLVYWEDEA